jgi:hypothetical protein
VALHISRWFKRRRFEAKGKREATAEEEEEKEETESDSSLSWSRLRCIHATASIHAATAKAVEKFPQRLLSTRRCGSKRPTLTRDRRKAAQTSIVVTGTTSRFPTAAAFRLRLCNHERIMRERKGNETIIGMYWVGGAIPPPPPAAAAAAAAKYKRRNKAIR